MSATMHRGAQQSQLSLRSVGSYDSDHRPTRKSSFFAKVAERFGPPTVEGSHSQEAFVKPTSLSVIGRTTNGIPSKAAQRAMSQERARLQVPISPSPEWLSQPVSAGAYSSSYTPSTPSSMAFSIPSSPATSTYSHTLLKSRNTSSDCSVSSSIRSSSPDRKYRRSIFHTKSEDTLVHYDSLGQHASKTAYRLLPSLPPLPPLPERHSRYVQDRSATATAISHPLSRPQPRGDASQPVPSSVTDSSSRSDPRFSPSASTDNLSLQSDESEMLDDLSNAIHQYVISDFTKRMPQVPQRSHQGRFIEAAD